MDKWPKTYEDLHQAGKKLKAAGTPIGHTLGHAVTDGATHNYSLMWSYGAKEFEADGKTLALDSKEMLDCLTFFQTYYKDSLSEKAFGWDETGNNLAYTSGQVAATNNANTIYAGLLTTNADLAAKSSHGTTLEGPGGAFQYMSMQFWGIPTYSKNVDAAKDYLKNAFYTKDFQTAWTKAGNGYNLPPFPMLDNVNEAWPTDPKLASARTLAKTTRLPGSPGPYTSVVGAAQNKFIIIDMFAKVAQGIVAEGCDRLRGERVQHAPQGRLRRALRSWARASAVPRRGRPRRRTSAVRPLGHAPRSTASSRGRMAAGTAQVPAVREG